MKLTEKDLILLYRILRPFVPSEDWVEEEIAEHEEFVWRLVRSLSRRGFDMKEDLETCIPRDSKVLELRQRGLTYAEIEKTLKVSKGYVCRQLKGL